MMAGSMSFMTRFSPASLNCRIKGEAEALALQLGQLDDDLQYPADNGAHCHTDNGRLLEKREDKREEDAGHD